LVNVLPASLGLKINGTAQGKRVLIGAFIKIKFKNKIVTKNKITDSMLFYGVSPLSQLVSLR